MILMPAGEVRGFMHAITRVLMPVRAFIDSDSIIDQNGVDWTQDVLMPVRAFIDSDRSWHGGRNLPPRRLNAREGFY